MNIRRAALVALASLTLSLALQAPAHADVRTLWPAQTLPKPASPAYYYFGQDVAIDGGHVIVLAAYEGGQHALLYRRNTNGAWVYRRVLASHTGGFVSADVAMKNGIAAVRFGTDVSIFEFSGGDYVRGASAAPIRHPGGVAISTNRILVGGNDCDYDAMVYQKIGGSWAIAGRLDDNQGECHPEGLKVELNYDHALLRSQYGREAAAWRRNGAALDWVRAGVLTVPETMGLSDKAFALQGATAVANSGLVYRRTGSTWAPQGKATAADHDFSYGVTFDAVFRDGVLLTTESGIYASPRAYLEISPGRFEHLATLNAYDSVTFHDISGRTVVAAVRDNWNTRFDVEIFNLPQPLRAPAPVADDFEDQDASDFQPLSGQFQLAAREGEDVLEQTNASVRAVALVNGSDWTGYQRIEADFTQTAGGADSLGGVVARYVDANNYYFVGVRTNNTFGIYRRVNGVETLLREGTWYGLQPARVALAVDGGNLAVWINGTSYLDTQDNSLTHGSAGLLTSGARADFDNVHVAATEKYVLLEKDYSAYGNIYGRDWTEVGGTWSVLVDEFDNNAGFAQSNLTTTAFAVVGTPIANQEITARIKLDQYGASQTGAWFGLLARYVDARNHYYVTARGSDQLQIRKQVNGLITVLASIPFKAAPSPGQYIEYRFRVIGDQLQLFVDGELVMSAHDGEIARGQYGLATNRAAATWEYVVVTQP